MHVYTHTHPHTHTHTHTPVDFVLKDPRQKEQMRAPPKSPARLELDVIPKPWNKNVVAAFSAMTQLLFVTNPTLNQVQSPTKVHSYTICVLCVSVLENYYMNRVRKK